MWFLKLICAVIFLNNLVCSTSKPNIIVIVADDLGWNDVGFHGYSDIPTPNIDALAYSGVILNSHYTQPTDTASRAAFFTGMYPIHTGMQHSDIGDMEPWGLGLDQTILPQYLQKNGYITHAIGKWGLGFYQEGYTPTHRGFDKHFGCWLGHQDYFDHYACTPSSRICGFDMRRDMVPDWDTLGTYATELFTSEAESVIRSHNKTKPMFLYLSHLAAHAGNEDDPLQVPRDEYVKFTHIIDPYRKKYAGMVSVLDKSVGRVIYALKEEDMLENSIIIFLSDNGAQTEGLEYVNHGSNYPLRGVKDTPWEGGTRGSAVVWSLLIQKPQRVSNQLMHISDWLPTLYTAIGLDSTELKNIDGKDIWNEISNDTVSSRTELVYNIDNYEAIRNGDWKYVNGTLSKYNGWYGDNNENDNYIYDENAVLNSDVAVALSDLVFSLQLQRTKRTLENVYQPTRITGDTINVMRNAAKINCTEISTEQQGVECKPDQYPCLFNINQDPCERINVAHAHPIVMENFELKLVTIRKSIVAARNRPADPNANPEYWNDTWTNWGDYSKKPANLYWTPLVISAICAAAVAFVIGLLFVVDYCFKKHKLQKEPCKLSELTGTSNNNSTSEPDETQPLISTYNMPLGEYDAIDTKLLLPDKNLLKEEGEHTSDEDIPNDFNNLPSKAKKDRFISFYLE